MHPSTLINDTENRDTAAIVAALALDQRDPSKVRFEPATLDRPALIMFQPDVEIKSLEHLAESPHRPSIVVALDSAKDLHAYINEHTDTQDHHPVIFASRDKQSITAFLDYHTKDGPRWLNHTAEVQYRQSHQFKRWLAMNNKHMMQDEFALFIDEMLQDFVSPTGADMLTFATCLEINSDQTFKSSTKLSSGETEFIFTDSRKGDVSTKVIDQFTIGVPVWQGPQQKDAEGNLVAEKIKIEAKLYHRLVDNKDSAGVPTGTKSLRFWYVLRHIERIIDALFAAEVDFLSTAFNGIATIYNGTAPEKPKALSLGF